VPGFGASIKILVINILHDVSPRIKADDPPPSSVHQLWWKVKVPGTFESDTGGTFNPLLSHYSGYIYFKELDFAFIQTYSFDGIQ